MTVGLAVVVRLAARAVDLDDDAGVIGRVGAGEADGRPGRLGAATGHADLRAAGVELGTTLRVGRVQRQRLDAQQVVARRDAGRQVELDPAVVGDQVVDLDKGMHVSYWIKHASCLLQ